MISYFQFIVSITHHNITTNYHKSLHRVNMQSKCIYVSIIKIVFILEKLQNQEKYLRRGVHLHTGHAILDPIFRSLFGLGAQSIEF